MKSFKFLAMSIVLLGSAANADCPDASTINQAIADTTSYDELATKMGASNPLHAIAPRSYMHDWERLQQAIVANPLTPGSQSSIYCDYITTDSKGKEISVALMK